MRTAILCALALTFTIPARAADPPPNIVFILADDVGVEPLGCYGGQSVPTPRIDRLAESGLRFNYAFSMPVCHPTRVCFLTGRYPRRIGNPKWGSFPQPLEGETVAHTLKAAGYATAVAGKWQLALLSKDLQQPHRMGFDEYCLFGWHEGPRYHEPLIFQNAKQREGTDGKYGPDLYVDFLIDFFKRHRDRPFFAFYSMALCHDVTDDLKAPVPYVPGKKRYLSYEEMVASMDHCVGRVTDALDELGLRERTWVVLTGDNGTSVGSIIRAEQQNGKWKYVRDPVKLRFRDREVGGGKGSLTDGGTRVPLLVSRPGTLRPGIADGLVDCSDFLPTFAALAGAQLPEGVRLDGVSFAAQLMGRGPAGRQWAYAEGRGAYWVRDRRYKLTSRGQLFDLKQNPREQAAGDLAEQPGAELDAVRQRLGAALKQVAEIEPAGR